MKIRHEQTGCPAPPAASLIEVQAARPGPLSLSAEKSAVSCQYKDNSVTSPKKVQYIKGLRRGAKPLKDSPISVVACHNQSWTLKLWRKNTPGHDLNIPFTCRTWRHEGPCREFKGAQDYVRISEGLKKFDSWVYIVLTWPTRKGNRDNVYKSIGRKTESFRRWIHRNYARPGESLEYVFLGEQHRDGWPHINLLIHLPLFNISAEHDWKALRRKVRRHAMSCGFGKVFWLEPMKNREAMAAYFVKLCHEVSKMDQAPMKAPLKFQRLRYSKGLLAPVHKDSEWTGEMLQLEVDRVEKMVSPRMMEDSVRNTILEESKERCARVHYENSAMQKEFIDSTQARYDHAAGEFLKPVIKMPGKERLPLASHPKIKKTA